MSNSQNGLADDLDSPENVRAMKEALYGQFQKERDQQARLSLRLAHKALDIAPDDMQNTVINGLGWRELLVMGALVLGGFGLAAWYVQQAQPPQEQEFEVRFYDAAGQPIQVPRLPEGQSGAP